MAQDVAELVPRVRRAIEGPVPVSQPLTDPQVTAIIADAIGDIIFYSEGAFGHTLAVTNRDGQNVPDAWAVDPELAIQEETVVAAQAALNYFFFQFKDAKVQESINDEGQAWSYQLSANVLQDTFKELREARDRALAIITQGDDDYTGYVSYIAERDAWTSHIIEPWVHGAVNAGLETDFRFGG